MQHNLSNIRMQPAGEMCASFLRHACASTCRSRPWTSSRAPRARASRRRLLCFLEIPLCRELQLLFNVCSLTTSPSAPLPVGVSRPAPLDFRRPSLLCAAPTPPPPPPLFLRYSAKNYRGSTHKPMHARAFLHEANFDTKRIHSTGHCMVRTVPA